MTDGSPAGPRGTAATQTGKKPAENPAEDSEIRIEPLIWLPTIEGTFTASDPRLRASRTFNGSVTPSQILPSLHFLLSGRAEGRDGRWGGFGEFFHVNAGNDARIGSATGNFSTKLTMVELAGFYRVSPGRIPVDLVAGVRMGTMKNTLDFENQRFADLGGRGISVSSSYTHVDPVIGARVTFPLGKTVSLQIHGDYGGFGIGDRQTTWRAQGIFGYELSSRTRLLLGYGAINFSSKRSSGLTTITSNLTFRGPVIGASFRI